jgi:hypothetical protein
MRDVVDDTARALADPAHARAFSSGLSRRAFVESAAMAVGAAAVSVAVPTFAGEPPQLGAPVPSEASAARPQEPREPVVGFYMDRPYLDPTGLAEPYVPPAGTRSGQVHAGLSESEFLSRHPYG